MLNNTNLLTTEEIAKFLNCKTGVINKLKRQNKIPYIKIGSLVRFDKEEVIKQLKENTDDNYF